MEKHELQSRHLDAAGLAALHRAAAEARLRAYAPYSGFQVGAAFWLGPDEALYTGANVENASYGATVCAERTALLSLVKDLGPRTPRVLVVVTQADPPSSPCALCLQVMAEFCDDDLEIYLATPEKLLEKWELRGLLPRPFRSFPR